jgi:hypothetical protein
MLRTGYLAPVRVCLLVAVGRGGCWFVVVVVISGVVLCRLGRPKHTMNMDEVHKIHAEQIQGRVFFVFPQKGEARRPQGDRREPEIDKQ